MGWLAGRCPRSATDHGPTDAHSLTGRGAAVQDILGPHAGERGSRGVPPDTQNLARGPPDAPATRPRGGRRRSSGQNRQEGYFNSVLTALRRDGSFADDPRVARVLRPASAIPPETRSRSFLDCADMIELAIRGRAHELLDDSATKESRPKRSWPAPSHATWTSDSPSRIAVLSGSCVVASRSRDAGDAAESQPTAPRPDLPQR